MRDGFSCPDRPTPKISIVTPSFNQGEYLAQCMDSVLSQDYPDLEYLVMDGGSTDSSREIIESRSQYLAYWCSQPDGGQAAALARGFSLCTGEIGAWLNSDDAYLPGTLGFVGDYFRRHPEVDVLYGNELVIDGFGAKIGSHRMTPYFGRLSTLGIASGGFGLYQPAVFWRRALYDRVGGLDATLVHCMDNDLFVRFGLHRARFGFVRKDLAMFRMHAQSKTCTLRTVAAAEREVIRLKYARHPFVPRPLAVLLLRTLRVACFAAQGDLRWLAGRALEKSIRHDPGD
jgi:glycosyltransferase involved in cell wall biosynthesis